MYNSNLNFQGYPIQNTSYVIPQQVSQPQAAPPQYHSEPSFKGNPPEKKDGNKKLRNTLIALGIAGAAAVGVAVAVKTGKADKIINACKDKIDDVAGSVSNKAGQAAETASTATTKAANAASKTAETAAKAGADKVDDVQTIAQRLNLKTENLPKIENGKIGDITMKDGKLFNADGKIFEGSITGKMKNGDVLELTSDGTGKICGSKRLNIETGDGFSKEISKFGSERSCANTYGEPRKIETKNIKAGKYESVDRCLYEPHPVRLENGSGFYNTKDGLTVTKQHFVPDGTKEIWDSSKCDFVSVPKYKCVDEKSTEFTKKVLPKNISKILFPSDEYTRTIYGHNNTVGLDDLKFEKGVAMQDGKPFRGVLKYNKNGNEVITLYDKGRWYKSYVGKPNGECILRERDAISKDVFTKSYIIDKNLDPVKGTEIRTERGTNALSNGKYDYHITRISEYDYVKPGDINHSDSLFDSSNLQREEKSKILNSIINGKITRTILD